MLALRLARPQLVSLAARVRLFSTTPIVAKTKLDLPPVPKSAVSSFSHYYRDFTAQHRSEFVDENGKVNAKTLVAAASDAWSKLPDAKKLVYKEKGSQSRKDAAAAYAEFWKSTTPSQRRAITRETGKKLRSPTALSRPARVKAAKKAAEILPDVDKASLPEVPKAHQSSYALFFSDYIKGEGAQYLVQEDGKRSVIAVGPHAGKAWAALPEAEKQAYKTKAAEAREAGREAYRKFWESTSPEVRAKIEIVKGRKLAPPGGNLLYKKEIQQRPGNPGKGVSAFFEFANEVRARKDWGSVERNVTEEGVEIGRQWRELSPEEKKKYNDINAEKVAKYKEWEATQPDLVAAEAAHKEVVKHKMRLARKAQAKEKEVKSESPESD